MSKISGLITYDKFVKDLLLKLKLNDDDYLRILRILSDGIQELNMYHINTIKNAKLTIDSDTNTISLPDDYLGFVRLSIPWKGRMWTFTRDDSLVITTDGTIGVDEAYDTNDGEGVNVADNGVVRGLGARGAVNRYYYTIDKERNRIAFSGFAPDFVILQYTPTHIDDTSTNYISRSYQRVLEYFVRYMNADYMNEPQSKVYDLERKYKEEVRNIRKFNAPTIDEIKDAIYGSTSQSIRR